MNASRTEQVQQDENYVRLELRSNVATVFILFLFFLGISMLVFGLEYRQVTYICKIGFKIFFWNIGRSNPIDD